MGCWRELASWVWQAAELLWLSSILDSARSGDSREQPAAEIQPGLSTLPFLSSPEPWHEAGSKEGAFKNFCNLPAPRAPLYHIFTKAPFVLVQTVRSKQFLLAGGERLWSEALRE